MSNNSLSGSGGQPELTLSAHFFLRIANKIFRNHPPVGTKSWLLLLADYFDSLIEEIVDGLDVNELKEQLRLELTHGQEGPRLSARELTNKGRDIAQKLGDSRVEVKHLAIAILESAGYEVIGEEPSLTPEEIGRRFDALFGILFDEDQEGESEGESADDRPKEQTRSSGDGSAGKLEEFGRNLTRQARRGRFGNVVGREEEIQLVIET
ncbi:MAG: hypothetical protein AB1374_06285, partial [Bacillota bacterium]